MLGVFIANAIASQQRIGAEKHDQSGQAFVQTKQVSAHVSSLAQ